MTTKDKHPQVVDLDKLVQEKLSHQILNAVEHIEIEIFEIVKPGFRLKADDKNIVVILKIPTKKLIRWFGGLTVFVSGTLALLKWLIPILTNYLPKPPP